MSSASAPAHPVAVAEVRDLVKVYRGAAGDFPALRGVSFDIQAGEFVAVLGRSGAGKTTLVNAISGIDRPTAGSIVLNGTPILALDEDARARWRGRHLGVVFQFFQLLPHLTLIENITIAMDLCDTYPLAQRKERALRLLDQVGLAEHAYKTPAKISGGQQQRVAIARALANDPALLVADEPTGNLDSETAGEILDLFERFVAEGRTLLLVTHDREIAARATRRLELADGEIVRTTTLPLGSLP